jgi:MSHA biogenesis protein MshI
LLAIFKSTQRSGSRAGVMISDRSIAIAVVRRRTGERPAIEHCAVHRCEGDEPVEQLLQRTASKLGLSGMPLFATVSSEDYQLVQVEAPEVQPAELRAAIRWRLRDVINFHIDDAVVDVFEIPDQSRRMQAKMLFAVAARSAAVQRLVNALAPVAKDFDVIDIPELCLRNVAALLPQDQKGVATLLLGERAAQLILTRQGVLYQARRIEYSRGLAFDTNDASDDSQLDAGTLALELQRSLDYYESHYDQTPITDLVIAPAGERAGDLAERLRAESSLRIQLLDLSSVADGTESLGMDVTAECLLALGATLRAEKTAL